ncbi:MAG: glycosyltransferase family 9 protein [Blastocatellia bacterium]|nr:glycosyltransferase family 9 protein [Blastocatellia bacterium]
MRILIVRLGAIGDVVHALPALAALRRAMPAAHLAWVVECGGAAQLLQDNPCLDELIELDLRGWGKMRGMAAFRETIDRLRRPGFDLALDFQGLLKSAVIPWLLRIPRRIGFERESLREPLSALLLTERVEVDDDDHVIKKNLRLAAHIGCEFTGDYDFPIELKPEDEIFAAEQEKRFEGDFAILNPGGGWPTKLWGAGGYAAIADRLWEAYRIRPVVTFGPGEEGLAQAIASQARTAAVVLLASSLKQFFALARRARLFIGGDTGPMHLAAAAGAPIVAIFGPTSSRRNGPFSSTDVVIEKFDLDCRSDCYRRACSHNSCMMIPAEIVWQGVEKRLLTAAGGSQKVGETELPLLPVR